MKKAKAIFFAFDATSAKKYDFPLSLANLARHWPKEKKMIMGQSERETKRQRDRERQKKDTRNIDSGK